jgi:hypothetical protein
VPSTIPSPQIGVHTDGAPTQFHPASIAQTEEQPSFEAVFESSQASVPLMSPSPQRTLQTEGVVVDPVEQLYPTAVPVQPKLHPFPSFDPSSHVSVPVTFESPQT